MFHVQVRRFGGLAAPGATREARAAADEIIFFFERTSWGEGHVWLPRSFPSFSSSKRHAFRSSLMSFFPPRKENKKKRKNVRKGGSGKMHRRFLFHRYLSLSPSFLSLSQPRPPFSPPKNAHSLNHHAAIPLRRRTTRGHARRRSPPPRARAPLRAPPLSQRRGGSLPPPSEPARRRRGRPASPLPSSSRRSKEPPRPLLLPAPSLPRPPPQMPRY